METTFQDATSALGSTHLGEYWARSLLEPVTFLEDLVKRGRNEGVGLDVQTSKVPDFVFRALLTRHGDQHFELARAERDGVTSPLHTDACLCGTVTYNGRPSGDDRA